MAWKVKKEMPIGSTIAGTGTATPSGPSRALRFSTRNAAYLNVTSDSRLRPTASTSRRRAAGVPRAVSMAIAAT